MKKVILLSILSILALTSCGNKQSSDDESHESPSNSESESSHKESSSSEESKYIPLETTYALSFDSILMKDEEDNKVDIHYDIPYNDNLFGQSGKNFNKDLALLSFASHITAHDKEVTSSFFETIGFDNIVHSPDYDVEETENTLLYNFAHRSLEDSEIIAINISSYDYKLPWINNAIIGKEGNATGYQVGADKLITALDEYVASYQDKNIKLWMSGYSRSAGIINIAAEQLLDDEALDYTDDNMYCYAFEAPAVFDATLKQDHPSIHNVINRADLITYMFPSEYNLVRAGHDIDIYKENADEIVSSFDERLILKPFTILDNDEGFMNEQEFCEFIIRQLIKQTSYDVDDKDYVPDLSTRDNYVDNGYEATAAYLLGFVFSLKEETLTAIKEKIDSLTFFEKMAIVSKDGLYNIIKPILDENNETYDDEKLRDGINQLIASLTTNSALLLILFLSEDYINDVIRVIQFHSIEFILPLLLSYEVDD